MKVKILGSNLCPDTMYALMQLKGTTAEVEFQNIATEFPSLKIFLNEREHNPLYDQVKKQGGIGIPFFTLEDGFQTFDLQQVLRTIKKNSK